MGAQLCTALLQLRDLDNKILQYWRIAFHSKHLLLEACLARGVPSKWNGMVHRRPFQGIEIEDDTPPEIETHIIESQSNYQTGSGSGVQQLAKKTLEYQEVWVEHCAKKEWKVTQFPSSIFRSP